MKDENIPLIASNLNLNAFFSLCDSATETFQQSIMLVVMKMLNNDQTMPIAMEEPVLYPVVSCCKSPDETVALLAFRAFQAVTEKENYLDKLIEYGGLSMLCEFCKRPTPSRAHFTHKLKMSSAKILAKLATNGL